MPIPSELAAKELVAKFKSTFSSGGVLLESYGAIARDKLLVDSVNQATADGVSIDFKGYGTDTYPYTDINNIYLPPPNLNSIKPSEAMTIFLFESRNAMRAKRFCELYKKATIGMVDVTNFSWIVSEYETRGGLETGRMWQQIIDKYGSNHAPQDYWADFYYRIYLRAPPWETNIAQLNTEIQRNLDSKYQSGQYVGKTRNWYYTSFLYQEITVKNRSYYQSTSCSGAALVAPLRSASANANSPIGLV